IDTVVGMASTVHAQRHYHKSPGGKKVASSRLLVFDSSKSTEKILAMNDHVKALKDGDPDLDMEIVGRRIRASNIYVDKDYQPVYSYKSFDILIKPNGERIERPHVTLDQNVNATLPVRVTDKYMDPRELLTKYIFRKSYFLSHHDGTSYKFLHDIATDLAKRKMFVRLQAYDSEGKKTAPLILSSNGTPFPVAFLEGKVDGDKYCLILHVADREFKVPDREITELEGENA
ncbi:MAG: hypothetical protein GYA24_00635, partial [Candidatus Lokiarchaeota archaeon]|nr:hypothetical protein [Candidatus Lokiarchaeota archaeon]